MSLIPTGLPHPRRGRPAEATRALRVTEAAQPPVPVLQMETEEPLSLFLRACRKYAPLLAIAGLLGGVSGWMIAFRQTPQYRAVATIEVQDLNENFLNLKEVASASVQPPAANDLQTQLRILQSASLLRRVAASIGWPKSMPADAPEDLKLEALSRSVHVRETRQSRIVDLTFEGPDSAYAARFVNELGQQYIDQSVESRLEISRSTSKWLEKQLDELRGKLAASERELQEYANQTGLLVTSQAERPDEEKLRQVQANLSEAQKNRMTRQARWEMAKAAPVDTLEPPPGSPLRDHQTKLAELRRQRAELLAVYTPGFAGVKRLDAQIADLEATMRREKEVILQAIGNDYSDAARREALLAESYQAQVNLVSAKSGKAIQYGILKHEVDSNRELYNAMLQKSAEAKVASALRASNARFVDQARAPRYPFKPSRSLSALTGASVGLLGAMLLVTTRERIRPRKLGARQMAAALQVPELGAIPDDAAPAPEVYRSLLTSILFSPLAGPQPRVLAVTSATAGEGKSEVVYQLARTLSRMRCRVLLMDASRNGALHRRLGQTIDYGLGDLMDLPEPGSQLLSYIAQPTGLAGVDLVAIGPQDTTALDLLLTQGFSQVIEAMRQNYEVVLIDTPALMEAPDARVFGRLADGVVVVVGNSQFSLDTTGAAVRRLQADHSLVLGIVLNRA